MMFLEALGIFGIVVFSVIYIGASRALKRKRDRDAVL